MPNDTIEVFISYSKQDKELRDGLLSHLHLLEQEGIVTWHDRQILPGTEWDDEIRARLNAADIILLLISADFLNTDYCKQVEIPEALRRHEANDAIVMPVILRWCSWQHTPLAKIQAYPEKAKPIKSWSDIDEAYTNVVDGVYLAATEIKNRRNQQQQAEEEQVIRKELQGCDSAKILFIKNVKHPHPNEWAYSLEGMQQPESRTFELMWRAGSHGVSQPKAKDLMILHQRAKVTHIVEFLDDQVRETDTGFFRWVRAVWLPEQDWNQLPHQKEILGFSPKYADGNTHALNGSGFSTFREAWSTLEEFQQHIFKHLTQSEAIVTAEDDLTSEKGLDYTRLRDFLRAGLWEEADKETVSCMEKVMDRKKAGYVRAEDIENLPCTDLHTIDQLWIRYSNGRFGFGIQKLAWEKVEGDYKSFSESIGWRSNGNLVDINSIQNAPKGYFPSFSFNISPNYLKGMKNAGLDSISTAFWLAKKSFIASLMIKLTICSSRE